MKSIKARNISVPGANQPTRIQQHGMPEIIPSKEPEATTIAVCVPLYGVVTANWLIAFMRFIMDSMGKYTIHLYLHEQQPVDQCRETLAAMALEKPCDYVMWLDSDNVMPKGGVERLIKNLEENNADIITALYFGKDAPHFPIIRGWRAGGFYKIENPALGQIIEIAGCGFGACIMKPEVLTRIKRPLFKFSQERWGYKDVTISEDLYFCRKAREAGFKILCDTGIVSSHIGGAVDVMEYMNYAPIRQGIIDDREELINDMAEFQKLPKDEIDLRIMVGAERMMDEWNEKDPKTPEEITKFYKETENYLYDLTHWHFAGRRRFDVELTTSVAHRISKDFKDRKIKILDFGCGIGQNAYMLAKAGADVTIADLDSVTLDFAEYRFKKHNVPYKVWYTDTEDMPPETEFDIILAFDILEHVDEETAKKYVDKLVKLKHPDTNVMTTNSYGTQGGLHPMHYELTPLHKECLQRFLYEGSRKQD